MKTINRLTQLLSILLALFSATPSVYAEAKESLVYIQVKETKLRSQPKIWAQSVADLTYGAALVAQGADPKEKSWIKVKSGSNEGYVHVSAITSRKVILSSSGVDSRNVDPSTVVMAGKGFNKQVENSFKSSKGLDFAKVDEAEKNKPIWNELGAFVSEGKLVE